MKSNCSNHLLKKSFRKTSAALLFTFLTSFPGYSQLNLNWGTGIGSIQQDKGTAMALDASGNVFISGNFLDTIDFDPSANSAFLNSFAAPDIFIAKYDATGAYIWAVAIEGGTMPMFNEDMAVDNSGNVYVTGYFGGSVDFDPGAGNTTLTASGPFDAYLVKFNSSGSFQWALNIGGVSADFGYGVAVDDANNVIITGSFMLSVDFDPSANTTTLSSAGNSPDAYLAKYDASGNLLWAGALGGSASQDVGNSVTADASGNIYVTGYFGSTSDFDPSSSTANLTSNGGNDIFLAKYDASGNYKWARGFGGSTGDAGTSVTTDAASNIYITGFFENTAQFDTSGIAPALTSTGGKDIFLAKYDSTGIYKWSTYAGSSLDDQGTSLTTDTLGNIFLTGHFRSTANFVPPMISNIILVSAGGMDAFIACYDSTGNYKWSEAIGGMDDDAGMGISLDGNSIYLTGYLKGTADLDPSSANSLYTSQGNEDIFLARYTSSCLGTTVFNTKDSVCSGQVYNFGSQVLVLPGTYIAAFVSSTGCDSIVNLTLLIDSVDVTLTKSGITLTANASTATTYQWIDCDGGNMAISGETNQSFTATANGNYAVVVAQNGCTDTSACIAINSVGISEVLQTNAIKVYPNPSNGQFVVKVVEPLKIEISDIGGKLIYSERLPFGTHSVNLENLPAGLYFLKYSEHKPPIKLSFTLK